MATKPNEPYIHGALASIERQTLAPNRVIVVVNGDRQAVRDSVAELKAGHRTVEFLGSPVPSMSDAFCRALERVETQYVAFLDADDEWYPDKQTIQVSYLDEHRDCDVTVGWTVGFREREGGSRIDDDPAWGRVFGASTFRADVFRRFGLPDSGADHFAWLYRWWSNAGSAGIHVARLQHSALHRRIHPTSGWVANREAGRSVLLAEVRRISSRRNHG